jgi:hypothetical protein
MKNYQRSPWGMVQTIFEITPWLHTFDTSSHGGMKLDRKHNELIPEYARRKGGWYEEDCEWAIVYCCLENEIRKEMVGFHKEVFEKNLEAAKKTLANWYPDIYEQFYEVLLKEGESSKKDQMLWNIRNKDNYKLYCAIGMINNVKVLLQKDRGDSEEHWFMIGKDLYESRRTKFGWSFTPEEITHFRRISGQDGA